MNDFEQLASPGVRGLRPYEPGLPLEELERRYGVTDAVKLASNENPLGPSPKVLAALEDGLGELVRYPDGNGFRLKQALAEKLHVGVDRITLGNGSNDVLELLVRAFVTSEQAVLFSEHAFAVYPIATQAVGARAVVAPARDWGHDPEAMLAAIDDDVRVVFVANPNNPTGTWVEKGPLKAFIEAVPEEVLVVVDEAYHEYATHPASRIAGFPDAAEWLEEHPNLVVTRTFSKAYGLAGLRVGYALSAPGVADLLNRVRQPFNVNLLALRAAEAALDDGAHLERVLELNWVEMARVTAALGEAGLDYIPSAGNFVSVDVGRPADPVYEALLREGVIVRPVAGYGMPRHLRVTIGLPEENDRALAALKKVLEPGSRKVAETRRR